MTNKNGYVILPESGDYALQMDATPILDFGLNVINIMDDNGSGAQHPGFVSGFNQTIVGKYFTSDTKAYRVKFQISTGTDVDKTYGDYPLNPSSSSPDNVLLSTETSKASLMFLSLGKEWRRGHNRLQGFYGGEAFVSFGGLSTNTTYEINYNKMAQDSGYIFNGSSRVLSDKSGTSFGLGLRGFVGVEYFVAPKISIGAEFGWNFGISTSPRGTIETENWGIESGSTATDPYIYNDISSGNSSGSERGFEVDNGLGSSAAITATFHF